MITLSVGLPAASVAGLATVTQVSPALGLGPSIALGFASGIVTLVITGLAVARTLHQLVR